jgi:transcription elongation factor GreB
MSKAFTKETDSDAEEAEGAPAPVPGGKNYITPAGHARLKEELHTLLTKTRPDLTQVVAWAASNGDRSENADYTYGKKRLREIDRRIRFLTKRLESAEVIDPTKIRTERIQFGATVRYQGSSGEEKTVQIVGIDESAPGEGKISWISPLAKALLNHLPGDLALFKAPAFEDELEILEVRYR